MGCKDGKNDLAYNNKGNETLVRTANDVKISGKPVERLSAFRRRTPNEIYTLAERVWGREAQIEVAKEELAELFVVLCKWGRQINGSTHEQIANEMADVECMLEQLKFIFCNEKRVAEIKTEKLERLQKRLEGDNQ